MPGDNFTTVGAGLVANPTAIKLASFGAASENGTLVVRWATSLELRTYGFRLYRSATGRLADAVLVTPGLIAATGSSSQGASYRWTDYSAAAGVRYSYWLEEIELSGTSTVYGPAHAARPAGATLQLFLPVAAR